MWVDVALDGAVGAVSSFVRLRQKAVRKRKTDRAFVSSVPRCDRNSRDSTIASRRWRYKHFPERYLPVKGGGGNRNARDKGEAIVIYV